MSGDRGHRGLHALGKSYMWKCHYCRKTVHCAACEPSGNRNLTATRDHVMPRSRRGRTRRDNLVLACFGCNQNKADALPHMIVSGVGDDQ